MLFTMKYNSDIILMDYTIQNQTQVHKASKRGRPYNDNNIGNLVQTGTSKITLVRHEKVTAK